MKQLIKFEVIQRVTVDEVTEDEEVPYFAEVSFERRKEYYGADADGNRGVIQNTIVDVELLRVLDSDGDTVHTAKIWDKAQSVVDNHDDWRNV